MIPKAGIRATNNAMRGHIPHSSIVSFGAKVLRQQEKKHKSQKQQKHTRLTEISTGSGKPVLRKNVGVVRAAKKLYEYEETGLAPSEVLNLIERERNLTERVKKMQDW